MSKFSERLSSATNEDKQVNPIYVQAIAKELPKVGCIDNNVVNGIDTDTIIYPEIKTDGVYKCYYIDDCKGVTCNYLLQLECKLDIDFTDRDARANVILQVICYLKQIHDNVLGYNALWDDNDSVLPKVVVIGSKINCFALPIWLLKRYAMEYIAGFKSASTAYTNPNNAYLLQQIKDDAQIEAYSIIFNTADNDCIKSLCNEIVKLGKNLKIADDLNEHTLSLAFDFFDMYVLDTKSASKFSSREKVGLFIGTFFNEEFEEITSRGRTSADKLRIHGVEVKVNPDKYNQFKILYNMREYSRLEQKKITAITDRLLEDTDRRRKGDFYTPTIWVDEAHKLLDKNLGENWRDEYMVWDCAWGTGNLTRDYKFSDLYCSTLQQVDLDTAKNYNKGAIKFQYDFLNDDVEEMEEVLEYCRFGMIEQANEELFKTKLYKNAAGLIDGLLGINGKSKKKLLFLINPPYGTAKNGGSDSMSKAGIAMTKINSKMLDNEIGASAQQLYAQFIYRILLIKRMFKAEIAIGMFSPPAYISGSSFKKLRDSICNDIAVTDGFIIQASQFADVSASWGITFTYLSNNGAFDNVNVSVLDYTDGKITKLRDKCIYNLDDKKSLSDWIKIKGKGEDAPQMVSAINWRKVPNRGKMIKNAFGYLVFGGNNIEQSKQLVIMLTSCFNTGNGVSITEENFIKCCAGFTTRKLCASQCDWINCKDEFLIPNENDNRINQFMNDAIIYSLFHSGSNQSSLRNIEYNGKTWNIQNEFFWMSVKDIEKLAGGEFSTDDINTAIEDDIEVFGKERFVYKKLQTVTLSPDAQAVLDKATELVKSSFKYRKQFNQEHPEYHINTWDAGWYQIKGMLKQYDPEGLKQFNELYKQLEDRMRPLVYELGFLYK